MHAGIIYVFYFKTGSGQQVKVQLLFRQADDLAAQRLSDTNQRSSAPKYFSVKRTHDVLSNAKISVTKPPWLFSKTVGFERL